MFQVIFECIHYAERYIKPRIYVFKERIMNDDEEDDKYPYFSDQEFLGLKGS